MDSPFDPHRVQSSDPHVTEPLRRDGDVVTPQRVGPADHDIDPDLGAGIEQHRATAALTIEHIHPERSRDVEIDIIDRLGGAECQRRPTHLQETHRSASPVGHAETVKAPCLPFGPHDVPRSHRRRLPTGDTFTPMTAATNGYLNNRTLIVTGAASGFGRLVTELASARGAHVLAADIDADGAAALAADLRSQGRSVHACTTDVTDATQMKAMATACVEHFGSIDVLVNNAGIMPLAFWSDHDAAAEAWDRCIDINFKGVVHGISAVHDQMIEQGRGHIVNISSIYGNVPVAGSAIYTATKAAVNVLSESLRIESQGRIKVTTVKPTGVLGTNLGASIVNGDAMIGILGPNMTSFRENAVKFMSPGESEGLTDRDSIRYWAISPEELAEQILYVIDQPWGVSISDITVRASGDQYLS